MAKTIVIEELISMEVSDLVSATGLNIAEHKNDSLGFGSVHVFTVSDSTKSYEVEVSSVKDPLAGFIDRFYLKDLESGKLFQSNADTISEKEKLKTILEQLKANLKRIEQEIIELKNNETFEVINNITNWDNYFTATKEQLKEELHNLTLEIES